VKTIFDRIHVWLAANAPAVLASLRPGATEEQLRAAERELGVTLPEDVKACYRIHDGQELSQKPPHWAPGFIDGVEWHSLTAMAADWNSCNDLVLDGTFARWRSRPRGPIRDDWWHPAWIPLTTDHTYSTYCLDLAPAAGGDVGQVIFWQKDDPGRAVKARSFAEWFSRFASELEAGEYLTTSELDGLVRAGDPYWG
jgi:cell wall assembly regulator SMI1